MNRRSERKDMVTIAGWLYADLLLAIAMVFFVFNTVGQKPSPSSTPTSTGTATPTATPTATFTPFIDEPPEAILPTVTSTGTSTPTPVPTFTPTPKSGLAPVAAEITFHVDMERLLGNRGAAARNQEQDRVRRLLRDRLRDFSSRSAGIVLTFGTTRQSEPTRGNELAMAVNALLQSELPDMFGNTVFKPYHYLSNVAVGDVSLEIYWILE